MSEKCSVGSGAEIEDCKQRELEQNQKEAKQYNTCIGHYLNDQECLRARDQHLQRRECELEEGMYDPESDECIQLNKKDTTPSFSSSLKPMHVAEASVQTGLPKRSAAAKSLV